MNWGILFSTPEGQSAPIKVVSYFDVDWSANPNDCKSITGYAFLLGSVPIFWALQKQKSVTLSSMEVEYIAAASTTSQML
jgi:hypothetical protein